METCGDPLATTSYINTPDAVSTMVDVLIRMPRYPPMLYVDLEGVNVSRHGSVSLMKIHALARGHTYVIDVRHLQRDSFNTPGEKGMTLREILQSEEIAKVFFDVRNASNALFFHHHIRLAGIIDIQLMENAARPYGRLHVNCLTTCILKDAALTAEEKISWDYIQERGLRFFLPEYGGVNTAINKRPLHEDIIRYCVSEVRFLPRLWSVYRRKLTPTWSRRVIEESANRVLSSQFLDFNLNGSNVRMAPASWGML